MNFVLDVIGRRFSCRAFEDRGVDSELIEQIVLAGLQAPSGMNRQEWQIIAVENRKLIEQMDAEGMSNLSKQKDKTLYNRIMDRGGKLFYNAPCMVVIAINDNPQKLDLIDLGIVAQNIVLSATSLGLGSVHCGLAGYSFLSNKCSEFENALQFKPNYKFGLAVLIGYPKVTSAPHQPIKSKSTFIK